MRRGCDVVLNTYSLSKNLSRIQILQIHKHNYYKTAYRTLHWVYRWLQVPVPCRGLAKPWVSVSCCDRQRQQLAEEEKEFLSDEFCRGLTFSTQDHSQSKIWQDNLPSKKVKWDSYIIIHRFCSFQVEAHHLIILLPGGTKGYPAKPD